MKESTSTAIEGIDFYLRNPEEPTHYSFWLRIRDAWAGRRDGRSLSTFQAAEHVLGDPAPELTSWAHDILALAEQIGSKERIVHEMAIDPARREMTRLRQIASIARAITVTATSVADEVLEQGPAGSDPVSAAEAYDSESARSNRRNKAHQALLAASRGKAAAAEVQAREADMEFEILTTRIEGANKALEHRLAEHAQHTRRRLAVYSRAISRRHPDARIISALTTERAELTVPTPSMLPMPLRSV